MELRISRRRIFEALGGGAALTAAGLTLSGCGSGNALGQGDYPPDQGGGGGLTAAEVDVLNFALNLEYLEGEFYTLASTGTGLPADLTGGQGQQGPTTGGRQVSFSDARVAETAAEIAADEIAHIRLLRSLLGDRAVAKPAINLAALGLGFANENEFLVLARSLSDVGTSAYAGSSRLLTNPDVKESAARILATEAYHMGNIRFQFAARALSAPPVDAKDQPPAVGNFFPADANSLAIARTAPEVVVVVRGTDPNGGRFFPSGLNGTIR